METLIPYEVPFKKVRVGSKGDGGYVVVDNNLDKYDTLVSMGICDDNNFEVEFNSFSNAYIQQYDYSIEKPPIHIENSDFFPIKVQSSRDLVKCTGNKKFLKLDIETSEWDLLPTMDLTEYEQIVIELHMYHTELEKIEAGIKHLTKNHKVVHVHANNCGFPIVYKNTRDRLSIMFNLLEVTLLRSDICEFTKNTTLYPTHLDTPSNTSKPEWELNFHPFCPM
jgi:hypothetical protein